MTLKQKILKAIYPFWMKWNKLTGKRMKELENQEAVKPGQSFYDLRISLNNGSTIPMAAYKGMKVMIVNTASDCGYTNQYEDLQKLFEDFRGKLMVIGFPANDFKEQEKGSDEEIARFCQLNYRITFPLAKKSIVIKSESQNDVFKWLTDKTKNGWNTKQPTWNFSKYLVNEEGMLTHYFDPSVSPGSREVVEAINMKMFD